MKLFRRKKKDKELHPFIVRILMHLNQKLLHCSNYLQKKTNHYSNRKRKIILWIFCIVFVSESSFLIIRSLQKRDTVFYTVTPIKFIPFNKISHPAFTGIEFKKIQQFKHYLDANKIFRESLLTERPRLMDTINFLEKVYQQKK